MAPGASTLRFCLRRTARFPTPRPVHPLRHAPLTRTIATTRHLSARDDDGQNSRGAQTTPATPDDISSMFQRYRKERTEDDKELSNIESAMLSKLEADYKAEVARRPEEEPKEDALYAELAESIPKGSRQRAQLERELEQMRMVPGDDGGEGAEYEEVEEVEDDDEGSEFQGLGPDEEGLHPSQMSYRDMRQELNEVFETDPGAPFDYKEPRVTNQSFWFDEEDDDTITHDVGGEEFDEDDITSVAHGKLDELREYRQYYRVAAWEMPLLSKLAESYEPPNEGELLRFRYTTYMGEHHPAERKVVVTFSPADLGLTPEQELKLKKLAGVRYDPDKDFVKMSCESFDHQAQNKRYLSDQVDRLIAAAKDPADMFEDVPLDLRHHPTVQKPKFPVEWRMTAARRQELNKIRKVARNRDSKRRREHAVVDGGQVVTGLIGEPSQYELEQYAPLLSNVYVRQKRG